MVVHDDELYHYGILRKSGRYPWGSGENPYQRNSSFLTYVRDLKSSGMTQTDIANSLGIPTTKLRSYIAIAEAQNRKSDRDRVLRLKEKGWSVTAIAKEIYGDPKKESTVRSLLNEENAKKKEALLGTIEMLKRNADEKGAIDIGTGVENHLQISKKMLADAAVALEEEGYKIQKVNIKQMGTDNLTVIKALSNPDVEWKDLVKDPTKIRSITDYSEDGGDTFYKIEPPRNVDSKRIQIIYAEDGGKDRDGLIELRPGVDDISLGNARYAQVRIAVDGTHYLKGMAMYADDLPDGVDIRFNTNKSNSGNKMDALKPLKDSAENPFGATIRTRDDELILAQRHYVDKDGKTQLSALNIVNEEGNWGEWSKSLASQMLSKQSPQLAKKLLNLAYDEKEAEYDAISELTNPVIKKSFLESFADDCDAASVKLAAAAMPKQGTHVILPIPSLKDNEIYAPNYENGENVVLVRYPHGGIFESPSLIVNNRQRTAKKLLGDAKDAVGINPKVAEQLSGADFDGDTVLVIPNRGGVIKTKPVLQGLKDFDPKVEYRLPEGGKVMSEAYKQKQMGVVSNLITDMTIKGATDDELCRAVKHSMVVIDAVKHKLDYKKSEEDNDIKSLKKKYQSKDDGSYGGASTLISKASSEVDVPERKSYVKVDPKTGKKIYTETGATKTLWKKNAQGEWMQGPTIKKTTKSTRMAETDDAYTLSSGTIMESVYAEHANKLKALANKARKDTLTTAPMKKVRGADETYAPEVSSLSAKLNEAKKNHPKERMAQAMANANMKQIRLDNPNMSNDDVKKAQGVQLTIARNRVGAKKPLIRPTEKEWEAIQAGAISKTMLTDILNNSDKDYMKQLATPRTANQISSAKVATIKSMLAAGYTQAEVAKRLGVSTSSINRLT